MRNSQKQSFTQLIQWLATDKTRSLECRMAIRNKMNTKPNQRQDRNKLPMELNGTKEEIWSEGNMAQFEKHPSFSKIASSMLHSFRQQTKHSIKVAGLATSLFLASANVHALGLGVLDVSSNLDQPLNGVITVSVGPGDDLSTLKAQLATREEFETLGVDYPEYLKNIKLDVERSGNDAVLRVSSDGVVIKEPFIHFLVKVSWSGGNFLREYTALIDPPVYASETPKSVAQPRAVGVDETYDNTDDSSQSYEDTTPTVVDVDEPAPAVVSPSSDYQESTAGSDGDARYGPVAAGESLSLIAQELQREVPDLSIYSIMKVLFEENTEAFIGANINGLIKGSILKIGDLDQIRATDVAEAKTFFRDQVNEWDPGLLVSKSSGSGIGVGQDNYTSDSDLFGDGSDANADSVNDSFQVGASSDVDTFVSSGEGSSSDGEVVVLRQELSQLQSSLASSELENQELSERISILEGQLDDMNRLMSLNVEDAELATLESTLGGDVGDSLDEESSLDAPLDPAEDAINEFLTDDDSDLGSSVDDVLSEFLDEEPVTDSNSQTDDLLASDSIDGEVADDLFDDTGIESTDETKSVIEEVEESEPVKSTISPVAKSVDDSESFLEKIGGLIPVLGGLGTLLAGGLGLFLWRRRRADEEFEISMLSIESNSQSVDLDTASGMSASMSTSRSASMIDSVRPDSENSADKETSFLTVYSDSDAVVQADEVDPIAEADVYIAYGRDEQAEEVLLDGISAHPERIDVKRKLVGLYYKNKNAEGFERIAEELFAHRDTMSGDEWQEISDMGKELVPENPLFTLSGDDFNVVDQASESKEDPAALVADSADDDLMAFETVDKAVPADEDVFSQEESQEDPELSELVVDSLNEDASIQLINFDDGRSEISELDEVEIDALAVAGDDGSVLEFNTGDDNTADNDDVLEFDLSDDSSDLNKLSEDDLVLDFESIDDDLDDDRKYSEVPEVSDLVIDPDYDEAQTQYELAKVFVDLGDNDGARQILEDLVANSENSAEVIKNAKELLDSMNG